MNGTANGEWPLSGGIPFDAFAADQADPSKGAAVRRHLGHFLLPGADVSVSVARKCAAAVLAAAGCRNIGDALLVTSEPVTNAVVHTRSNEGWVMVGMHDTGNGLIGIEVLDDGAATVPFPRLPDDGEVCGRGLWLVDELSAKWGVRRTNGMRSAVWALVDTSEKAAAADRD
ncbi:ATP-binding protein [Nonomuraea sp. CA-143628]|uniref:ATP-binding protein n=1 Tax=Nonomuraea sp. CA-143628 TaxID=3239997 RepID=UPI003D94BB50